MAQSQQIEIDRRIRNLEIEIQKLRNNKNILLKELESVKSRIQRK